MTEKERGRQQQAETYWKELLYAVYDGLSWFNTAKEGLNAHTVNMITAVLYKICTQILIRSINGASTPPDKSGHSGKSGPCWWWIHPEEEHAQLPLLRHGGRIGRERGGIGGWLD